MRRQGSLRVAVIEPVGGHGGMDYSDVGLCGGLAKAGVETTLYTGSGIPCDATLPFEVKATYLGVYGSAPAWLRGIRYIRGSLRALVDARLGRKHIAHFHFFHVGPLEFFNVILAKLLGLRVVATAHDVQAFAKRWPLPWIARKTYEISDRIVAHSKVSQKELITALDVPRTKIYTIPHGNYLPFIGHIPPQEEARSQIGVPKNARVLLFFGQIKQVKGLDVLLRAMPEVIREYPETLLSIAGKVWKDDFRRYQSQIDALGITNNCVCHTRYIPNAATTNYYAAADIIVLPYRKIYQSAVLLMAMSYGKPVVVSDIEGMTEVVTDGVNGRVFSSSDPDALSAILVEMLSD